MFIPDGIFDMDGSTIKSLISNTYITIKRANHQICTLQQQFMLDGERIHPLLEKQIMICATL